MRSSPECSVYLAKGRSFDDLFHKGREDQARHKQKIKEAVKKQLPEILSSENIITGDGKKTVKVPIRGINIPRFKFGEKGDGQGEGGGKKPGDQPGEDYYEVDYEMDEITKLLFEDMGLPWLEPRGREIESEEEKFHGIEKKGLMPNVDKKRTIKQNIMRNIMQGRGGKVDKISPDDLRFKVTVPVTKPESNAVVIAMRDNSGSMGEFEKYITRTSYFWMVRFLRTKYKNVEMVFITHHTEAIERNEEEFFNLGESGGTIVSSAYKLSLDIINKRYNPSEWNIYPFHFSDGDNLGEGDNKKCVDLINEHLRLTNMFGYAEIKQRGGAPSRLLEDYKKIVNNKFVSSVIKDKEDVYPALRNFFAREGREGAVSRV